MRAWLLLFAAAGILAPPPQRQTVFDQIRMSTDIAWLESLASSAQTARQATPPNSMSKDTKGFAYVRLGAIGSADAVAALRRIEAAARTWSLVPSTVSLDVEVHPASHFGDSSPKPLASVTGSDGVTYALFPLSAMGGHDLFLATKTSLTSPSWTRPLLLPNRADDGIDDPQLTWVDADHLRLDFQIPVDARKAAFPVWVRPPTPLAGSHQTWDISLASVRRDTDGDGWTDIEEARLGLKPDHPDSDGDGIPDGLDVCPNYAAPVTDNADPEVAILQKVFFAEYGIHESPYVLLVDGDSRRVQLWGSRGPVLFGVDRNAWLQRFGGAPPQLSWKVTGLDSAAGNATVTVGDYEGSLAAAGYTATLHRIDGEWFVVSLVMNWIS